MMDLEAQYGDADVPQVTNEDFEAFHKLHFSAPKVLQFSSDFIVEKTSNFSSSAQPTAQEDDLGFYEDGEPRTLTDDQIAIFRNTEIQTLLRQRRLLREQIALGITQSQSDPDSIAEADYSAEDDRYDSEEYEEFLRNEKEQLRANQKASSSLASQTVNLNYDGGEDITKAEDTKQTSGRRIISYEDIEYEPSPPLNLQTTDAEDKAFQWPTIG